jgi:hypothetical protein
MTLNPRRGVSAVLSSLALAWALLAAAGSCRAQEPLPQSSEDLTDVNDNAAGAPSESALTMHLVTPDAEPQAADAAPVDTTGTDDQWHIAVTPYLWFPGIHGTAGALGAELSVHASAADLLSNFRFGLMGIVEARHDRLVLPLDVIWVRLGQDKTFVIGQAGITVNYKVQEFIMTPKIGYRVINQEKFKVDALTGFRFFHLGQSLNFNPCLLCTNFSGSQNWVDPLVGGRIQMDLTPKVVVNIFGDVGGWSTGANIDYEIVGALGYRIKPKWTLQVGYRYMGVDYSNNGFLFNVITPGIFLGATINLR